MSKWSRATANRALRPALIADYSKVEPIAPAIIERRVELRMQRKEVLEQEDPVSLLVVLDESVLKRQFGDKSVMYEQMQSLAADSARPNVTLRVLPLRTPRTLCPPNLLSSSASVRKDEICMMSYMPKDLRTVSTWKILRRPTCTGSFSTHCSKLPWTPMRWGTDPADSRKLLAASALMALHGPHWNQIST